MVATAARKTGSVQERDTTAYDTPKRATEPNPRLRPPAASRGTGTLGWNPSTTATPSPASAAPMATESQGATCCTDRDSSVTRRPTVPNTATKPAVTTAPTTRAWATYGTAGPSSAAGVSAPRKYER